MASNARLPRIIVAAIVLVALIGVALIGVTVAMHRDQAQPVGSVEPGARDRNEFDGRHQYVDPDSRTSQAAGQAEADGDTERGAVFARLAAVPAGIWLSPERYPLGAVGPYVDSIVTAADADESVPLFVIYGVPDRDCSGGLSAGGLDAQQYGPWIQEIANAVALGERAAVVLEPDALAAAMTCDLRPERIDVLADAVERLSAADVSTYIDAGHSDWISPKAMARLLGEVGVESVRGFATNVSNYQTDEDERLYAEDLSERLGGVHYVIDNGRNGNGSIDEWCNPPGRAFGNEPGFVDDGTHLDSFLWVKPPGESDGECQGGPAAGEFWPERALQLAEASGW